MKNIKPGFYWIIVLLTLTVRGHALELGSNPSTLPLLYENALEYRGGFRVPDEAGALIDYSYGGTPLAYNPVNNSIFLGSWHYLAEITIPTPVNSTNVQQLPTGTFIQSFADPTEGHFADVSNSNLSVGGALVYGNRLYSNTYIYYDADNGQRISHYSRSLSLTEPSFSGWSQVWQANKQSFVAGYMALVPQEWQSLLGGPAITGQCCLTIITRTSFGPAAFAFDPAHIGQPTVAVQPLLYYPSEHRTLGDWNSSNPTYGANTGVAGVVLIPGTRTALFIGRNGTGPYCYGDGVSDPALADGVHFCYDPVSASKGQHSYPYNYQIWAYDLNDFAAVRAGTKQPWEVLPYRVWRFTLPTTDDSYSLGGVGYDTQRKMLYISQLNGDRGEYIRKPIIHAFYVNEAAPEPPPTPPSPPPPASPPPSGPLPAPILNLPTHLPVNGTISASYPAGYPNIGYRWLINPATGTAPSPAAGVRSLGAISASFQTASNSAALANYALEPGYYTVAVQAFNSSGSSVYARRNITLVAADFSGVRVFPNPWRADRHATASITFDHLPLESTIKIFTVSGHLVKSPAVSMTSAVWDLTNDSGEKVAAGIYLYLIKVGDQKKQGKVVIIK